MAKTWNYAYYYVDRETGEYLTRQEAEKNYNKKHYKTEVQYNGRFNIKKITYTCTKCGEQLKIW